MTGILNVHLLPELADPHDLAGHTSVVVDILRASTTITTALQAGAASVVPCLTVEEARQLAADRPGALLGGERGGRKLEGFDFGNSPAEYTPAAVADRTIVFTTTNGTRAMTRCVGSSRVLCGAIINRQALCETIQGSERIDIVCSGTDGAFSLDDALGAGAIVDRMCGDSSWRLNDSATACRSLWQHLVGSDAPADRIVAALTESLGGRNLTAIGMTSDLPLAARVDGCEHVPELDRATWEIR